MVTIVTTAGRFSSPGGWNVGSFAGERLRFNVQAAPVTLDTITVTDPVDLKTTAEGHLYVLSKSTATIRQYDANAALVRSLGGIGSNPGGLDVDDAGNVYVAMTGNHQVWKFRPIPGSFEADTTFNGAGRIGKADGTAGSASGEFDSPFDVAVTPDGEEIVVSDSANHRIQRFSRNGVFIDSFGQQGSGVGQFNSPKGLTHDGVGYLYIVDSGNNRVVLALSSAVIGTSGTSGTALGQFQGAVNLCLASRGIYVADTGNNRVQVFDPVKRGHGSSATPFNTRLALSIQFSPALSQPNAVAQVADFLAEKIYIADSGNNRVIKATLPASGAPADAWDAMKTKLVNNGDVEGAISHFSSTSADDYRRAFYSIGLTQLAPVMSQIPALTPVLIDNDAAQYRFDQAIDGITITFPVEFAKENGIWKILEY